MVSSVVLYMMIYYAATIGTEKGLSWEAALTKFGFEAQAEE